jgi:nucleotide-binding universal stress UspA family protein
MAATAEAGQLAGANVALGPALPMWKLMAEIEGAARKLENIAARPVVTSAVTGSIVGQILKYVSKHRIDLVVMR